jgi:hypothetical protein
MEAMPEENVSLKEHFNLQIEGLKTILLKA